MKALFFVALLPLAMACRSSPPNAVPDARSDAAALPGWADRWWRVLDGRFGSAALPGDPVAPDASSRFRIGRDEVTFHEAGTPSFRRHRIKLEHADARACRWSNGFRLERMAGDGAKLYVPFDDGSGGPARTVLTLTSVGGEEAAALARLDAQHRPPADACVRADACCRDDGLGGRMICAGLRDAELDTCASFLDDARNLASRERLTLPRACK